MKAIYGATMPWRRHQGQPDQVRRLGHRVRQLEHGQQLQHARRPTGSSPTAIELDQVVFRLERDAGHGADRPHRLGFPLHRPLRHGLPLHDGRRLGQRSAAEAQPAVRLGSRPKQYVDVYIPGFLEGMDHPRRPLDRLPGHRDAVRPGQLHGQPLAPVHLRHLHADRHHAHLRAQRPVDGSRRSSTPAPTWPPGTRAPSPTGAFGVRWVSKDNNDAFYTWLNAINNAEFRHFEQYGQPLGHDNFNYFVTTWEHRFNEDIHTKTEAYFMWQRDAEVGGTPSVGPVAAVRRRRRRRHAAPGPVPDLRRAQLHDVRPHEEGLHHGPQRVVAGRARHADRLRREPTPATPSA